MRNPNPEDSKDIHGKHPAASQHDVSKEATELSGTFAEAVGREFQKWNSRWINRNDNWQMALRGALLGGVGAGYFTESQFVVPSPLLWLAILIGAAIGAFLGGVAFPLIATIGAVALMRGHGLTLGNAVLGALCGVGIAWLLCSRWHAMQYFWLSAAIAGPVLGILFGFAVYRRQHKKKDRHIGDIQDIRDSADAQ
jgi:hypothetical protein